MLRLLVRPFDQAAAIIVYSTTKYLGGHGTSIDGLLIDGGNFDWAAHPERQPALNTPDPSYHGAVWTEAVKPLGPIGYIINNAPVEPLLPVEKKLIGCSLGIGLTLLAVLIAVNYFDPIQV